MKSVLIKNFISYPVTIPKILEEIGLRQKIESQTQILIKPNLTLNLPPPVTTPVELVEEVVKFCQKNSKAKIIIGEGAGGCETEKCFKELGYWDLAKKYQVELLDLNLAKRVERSNPNAHKLKKVALPTIAFESYIINLPVLKIHKEAKMTAALKNIFGFYLNSKYLKQKSPAFWIARALHFPWWNKSELHIYGVHQSIVDLNRYIKPDFHLVDASVGQLDGEIYGRPCEPPLGKIIAGYNGYEVDLACAQLLKINPAKIKYLNLGNFNKK